MSRDNISKYFQVNIWSRDQIFLNIFFFKIYFSARVLRYATDPLMGEGRPFPQTPNQSPSGALYATATLVRVLRFATDPLMGLSRPKPTPGSCAALQTRRSYATLQTGLTLRYRPLGGTPPGGPPLFFKNDCKRLCKSIYF